MLRRITLAVCVALSAVALVARDDGAYASRDTEAVVRLGERLFRDTRFSTTRGDLPASCSNCHLYNEDPQGLRSFTDFFNKSWVSSRTQDPRRLGLRNSPTLLDVDLMSRLHHDGEFGSLEDLVRGTISGRTMGWLPGEEDEAFENASRILLEEKKNSYRDQFRAAFDVDLAGIDRRQRIDLLARAVAAYMRTLKSRRDSPYDRFVALNRLPVEPGAGETAVAFGSRLNAAVAALESGGALKLIDGFGRSELEGLKIFNASGGSGGSCVACHAPPVFTDMTFHNLGIAQREYDDIHGDGEFAQLEVPDSGTRPVARLRETPSRHKPLDADLGYWNFVDPRSSPLRGKGESERDFLRRMIGTFKTPTLRNLAYSYPYLHNGSLNTLEQVLGEFIELSGMARAGRVRQADQLLPEIRITKSQIPPLVAFLNSLNEDLSRGF